ncbi:23S rRNA (pseudouridine1915-N3)-methyltransferase [Rhodopseudomonas julia]|uniref:Ribosomal RNA large subunit methyltransferase H n=1 Tax=Rhodopseudomonas julia TaxID=200617 RepID=A0ABU0C8C3_9BRAD|nr:23S rRNA (pseudouridine(1915)-N(3))-methyltransferase RlmH [Rhodopseudomonas julia]MDQ0326438.1 23S rRNA (pseudouridine1915-N3)-methyltransferase [Rhodopseudomonas julia]
MQIFVLAVGRMKAGPEADLAARYLERVGKGGRSVGISGISVREIAESSASRADDRKAEEAASLKKLAAGYPIVALDETGRNLSSEDFAGLIGGEAEKGVSGLCLVIGGPDGLDPSLREEAIAAIAFGRMTWPHKLARAMLAEQVYRAVTILSGHPYHRA